MTPPKPKQKKVDETKTRKCTFCERELKYEAIDICFPCQGRAFKGNEPCKSCEKKYKQLAEAKKEISTFQGRIVELQNSRIRHMERGIKKDKEIERLKERHKVKISHLVEDIKQGIETNKELNMELCKGTYEQGQEDQRIKFDKALDGLDYFVKVGKEGGMLSYTGVCNLEKEIQKIREKLK